MLLSDICVYPVKSCQGHSVERSGLHARGLRGDRRAMLIDASGKFLSLRSHGKLALITPQFVGQDLVLDINGERAVVAYSDARADVTVWRDEVNARVAADPVNAKLSTFLGEDIRLVVMDAQSTRAVPADWVTQQARGQVSFADAYPILIANTASLSALSETAGQALSMAQFRPNLVIDSDTPWAEDSWKVVRIGDIIFDLIHPCTRCEVTKLDPDTGEMKHPETMEALIKTRRSGDKRLKGVLFGWNAIPRAAGELRRGDEVEVLDVRTAWPIL